MAIYIAILVLLTLLMLVLSLLFGASAKTHKGKDEYVVLRMLQWAAGVQAINQVAHIITELLLFFQDDRLEFWLVIAGVIAASKLLFIVGILFELLGGNFKRSLFAGWKWLGDYLENG